MSKGDAEVLYLVENEIMYYRIMIYSNKLYVNSDWMLTAGIKSVESAGNIVIIGGYQNLGINCRSEEDKNKTLKFLKTKLKL